MDESEDNKLYIEKQKQFIEIGKKEDLKGKKELKRKREKMLKNMNRSLEK